MRKHLPVLCVVGLAISAQAGEGVPSRKPAEGCKWEKLSDAKIGLEAFVQRCTYKSQTTDFLFSKGALAVRYSDVNREPDPVVEVYDLGPNETAEAGITRFFNAHTDKAIAARCVLAPYKVEGSPTPKGVQRFAFVPDAKYAKELKAKEVPGDIPDPACGEWGDQPDSLQYFEAQPASGAARFLFVRIGQEEPLFDEQTLRILPGTAAPPKR
jgi:hypothetical protein